MPDQEYAEFEPTGSPDPHAGGEPRQSARDLAQQAAREAVRGPSTTSPGTRFDSTTRTADRGDEPLQSETSQHADFEDFDEPVEPTEDVDLDDSQEAADLDDLPEPLSLTDEDFQELQELGIDLPVRPSEVPQEFQDTYADLVQTVMDIQATSQERIRDAQEAILRVRDFSERLSTEEGQQRLLLTMALTKPETFSQAVEQAARMQDDPEYAESVRRQLEAEMRYEAATRKEQAVEQTQMARKARQVESRAVRLAKRLGVDPEFAKEQVAHRILLNETETGKRDISLEQVDAVIKGLAKRMGSKPRRRSKSPTTQERESRAPTDQRASAGRERPAGEPSGGQPRQATNPSSDPMDSLRSAVRQASKNIRRSGL